MTKATSKKIASIGSDKLQTGTKNIKSIWASAISQVDKKKTTSSKMASKASSLLKSKATSSTTKKVAGSVLGQREKKK